MDTIVARLKEQDLLTFDDGRYIMWAPGIDIPLTVVKVRHKSSLISANNAVETNLKFLDGRRVYL